MTILCTGILLGIIFSTSCLTLYLMVELDDLGMEHVCRLLYLAIFIVIFICVLVIVGRSLGWNI